MSFTLNSPLEERASSGSQGRMTTSDRSLCDRNGGNPLHMTHLESPGNGRGAHGRVLVFPSDGNRVLGLVARMPWAQMAAASRSPCVQSVLKNPRRHWRAGTGTTGCGVRRRCQRETVGIRSQAAGFPQGRNPAAVYQSTGGGLCHIAPHFPEMEEIRPMDHDVGSGDLPLHGRMRTCARSD